MRNTESDISLPAAHSLLGTKTRCQVVTLLLEVKREWDVEAFAAALVRLDPTVAPDGDDDGTHTTRVATRLYHCALPKLAAADVVEFDSDAMSVSPSRNLEALGAHLDQSLDYSKAPGERIELTV